MSYFEGAQAEFVGSHDVQGVASVIHQCAQIYGIPASYSSVRKHEDAFTAAPPAPKISDLLKTAVLL